jgi:flagellar capping protein FliD
VEDTFGSQNDVTKQTWNPQDGDSPYDADDTGTYFKVGTRMTYSLIRNGKPVGSPSGSTLLVDGTNVGTFTASGNTVDLSVHGFGKTKLSVSQAGTYKFQVSGAENNGKEKFDSLIKAYNDLRTQVQDVTKVTVGADGKVTAAILSGNRDLVNLLSTVRSRLFTALEDPGSLYANFSSSYDRLERVGITFDRNGVLSVSDSNKLTSALRDYPSRVNALFNSGASYVKGTGTTGNDYFTASDLDSLAVDQTLSGTGIPSGTRIASIDTATSRVYLKNAAGASVNLTSDLSATKVYLPVANQGLSVRLGGLIETLLDTSSSTPGLFKTSSTAIANENKTLQRQIDAMDRQLAARQASLEKSFIAMEKAQARSQSLLSQLTNAFQK